jgi:hypothetical protein
LESRAQLETSKKTKQNSFQFVQGHCRRDCLKQKLFKSQKEVERKYFRQLCIRTILNWRLEE